MTELSLNPEDEVRVLTDYDNVPQNITSGGPGNVVSWIFSGVESYLPKRRIRVTFKFFGGWYEGQSLTKDAQLISAELATFPRLFSFSSENGHTLVTVNAHLAHSLETLPRRQIQHTLRVKGRPRKMRCKSPCEAGCEDTGCPLTPLQEFLKTGQCPQPTCNLGLADLIQGRVEQKLVDTMLVADLIYLAQNKEPTVCVVTSDDDVWPGIMSAMVLGTRIVHLRPKSSKQAIDYAQDVPGLYTVVQL